MCEEGNLPVCHISCGVVHFLCLQEMTSITFSHAWLEPWQQSQQRHKVWVCVCVIVCKRKREGAITRIFFVGFHVSRHVWVLVCTSLAHVCVRTSISQTNLELMCAIVFLCTLANFPSSQMKLSFESFYIMSHAVLAGAVCHNGSRWCKMWPSCQEPAKYISLRELFEPLHVKPSS